ncbi:MAG: relaxase/mobilization nuclease domain-containing protein [Ruminococcus sp.]|nr:relaxase/mobilization nuclease domain-containing protein [Ruminococcus sp.]
MCIVKMVSDPYNNESSIFNLVKYTLTDKLTGAPVRYYGGYNIDVSRAAEQIVLVKQYFHKWCGRKMRHFIVSFDENITPYQAYLLGWQISAYYANRFQIVFGVHEDTGNVHIHFIFNTVSFIDGLKYSEYHDDLYKLNAYVKRVYENALSSNQQVM